MSDLPDLWWRRRNHLMQEVARHGWSIGRTASAHSMSPATLHHWWKRNGCEYPAELGDPRAAARLNQQPGTKQVPTETVVVEVEPAEVRALRKLLARKDAEVKALKKELDVDVKAANHREDVLALLQPVAVEAAYPAPPKPRLTPARRKRTPVEIVVHLCDIHWGEIVRAESVGGANVYNCMIAARRIEHVVDVVRNIAADQPGGVSRIIIAANGDAASGQHILHPDSADEESRIVKQVLDVASIIAQVAVDCAAFADEVLVIGTQGNHGRSTRKMPTGRARIETSWETLLHEFVAAFTISVPRIKVRVARAYTVTERIGPSVWAFSHGDGTAGGGGALGIPAYGLKRKHDSNREWSMVIAEMVSANIADAVIRHTRSAHFHTYFMWQAGRGTIALAPSVKGIDSYVLDKLGKYSPAAVLVEVVHPEHDVIRQTVVEVQHIMDADDLVSRYRWGALDSDLSAAEIATGLRK